VNFFFLILPSFLFVEPPLCHCMSGPSRDLPVNHLSVGPLRCGYRCGPVRTVVSLSQRRASVPRKAHSRRFWACAWRGWPTDEGEKVRKKTVLILGVVVASLGLSRATAAPRRPSIRRSLHSAHSPTCSSPHRERLGTGTAEAQQVLNVVSMDARYATTSGNPVPGEEHVRQ